MESRRRSRVQADKRGAEPDAKRLKQIKTIEREEMRNILADTAVFSSKYELHEPDPKKAEL
jgi:energy-converting hydrogenase A subunit M